MFVFVGTHLDRQFEFVKTQWLNDGVFIGAPVDRSPPLTVGGACSSAEAPSVTHPGHESPRMPGFYPCPECGNEDTEWATAAPNLRVCRLEVTAKTLATAAPGLTRP